MHVFASFQFCFLMLCNGSFHVSQKLKCFACGVIIRSLKKSCFAFETTGLVIVVWHGLCLATELKSFIMPHTHQSKHARIYNLPSKHCLCV